MSALKGIAAGVAVAGIAVGSLTVTAPSASAIGTVDKWDKRINKLKGNVSWREDVRIYRALVKQKCVTPREVSKIANAQRLYTGGAGSGRKAYSWDGRKADGTRYWTYIFDKKGCLIYGEATYFDYVY